MVGVLVGRCICPKVVGLLQSRLLFIKGGLRLIWRRKAHGASTNVGKIDGSSMRESNTVRTLLPSTSLTPLVVETLLENHIVPMRAKEGSSGFSDTSPCSKGGCLLNVNQIVPLSSFVVADNADSVDLEVFERCLNGGMLLA